MNTRREGDALTPQLDRWAWLPLPVLLIAMVVLWVLDLHGAHESAFLAITLNLVFSMLVAALVVYLIARSFLVRGTPGLLLMGCGMILWGPAGAIAMIVAGDDFNVAVTIHNSCLWLSALCHLGGVALSARSRRVLHPTAAWLPVGYVLAVGAMIAIVLLTHHPDGLPTFFVQGEGGTPLRQFVLMSAIVMFALTASLLVANAGWPMSAFTSWYALSLSLMAVGLLGVSLQSSTGSVLNWTARGAQLLGGLYMLAASIASWRESGLWGASLEASLRDSEDRYRTLFETAPDAVVVYREGRLLQANDTALRLIGADNLQQAAGRSIFDYLSPGDRRQAVERIGLAMKGRRLPVREATLVRLDGREMPVEFHAARIDFQGAPAIQTIIHDISERKRAEEELRRSAATFSQAFQVNAAAMTITDIEDGRIIDANERWLELTGLRREQAIGHTTAQCGVWKDLKQREAVIRDLQRHGAVHDREVTGRRPDGQEWTGLMSALVITMGDRRVLLSSALDITERKQAEEVLRRSNAQVREILESIRDGFYRLDRQWRFVYVNRQTMEFFRLEAKDLIGRTVWEVFPETVGSKHEFYYRKAMEDREVQRFEMKGAKFSDKWFSGAVYPSEDGISVYWQDISEHKRAEEALRRSQEQLRSHIENSPLGVVEWDQDFVVTRWAGEAEKMFGWSAAETVGKRIGDLNIIHPDDAHIVDGVMGRLTDGTSHQVVSTNRNVTKAGDVRHCIWHNSVLLDADGKMNSVLSLVQDVTEQTQAEEMLRRWNETLEDKILQRTAELQHRAGQLQRMTLEVSQAEDRERDRLAEVLHDDLQQIIAGAKFHLNLLRRQLKSDESLRALGAEIDQMLKEAIDKSRSLSHELSPTVLHSDDFGDTLKWLAEQMRIKHGLDVRVHARGEQRLQLEAIRSFLYRTAQELLFNVVKHARVTEVDIWLKRRGHYVCLLVADHGRGFDPDELREATGYGLLSIRERIELLGGHMKIRSAKGRGSAFSVMVPDGAADREEFESRTGSDDRTPETVRAATDVAERWRVLLADDHRIVREGLRSLLKDEYSIDIVGEAAHGREAVDLALRLEPDVVIMDVSMPVLDGDVATRHIKKRLPKTRVIALSTYNEPDVIRRMYQAGAEGYVLKTASSDELLAAIRGNRPRVALSLGETDGDAGTRGHETRATLRRGVGGGS